MEVVDKFLSEFAGLSLDQQLELGRKLRERSVTGLQEKLNQLKMERDSVLVEYDAEIQNVRDELQRSFGVSDGVGSVEPRSERGQRLYEFLKQHAGQRFTSTSLTARTGTEGYAAVLLSSYVQEGRVRCAGDNRSKVYWVEADVGSNPE